MQRFPVPLTGENPAPVSLLLVLQPLSEDLEKAPQYLFDVKSFHVENVYPKWVNYVLKKTSRRALIGISLTTFPKFYSQKHLWVFLWEKVLYNNK